MPKHRIDSGWAYYLKNKDWIKVLLFDDDEVQLEMPGSRPKLGPTPSYFVTCVDGYWRCECEDFEYRRCKGDEYGASFGCKHIAAAYFKIAELKGVNLQTVLF